MDARAIQFQKNSEILKKYLPDQSVGIIAEWIIRYDYSLLAATNLNMQFARTNDIISTNDLG